VAAVADRIRALPDEVYPLVDYHTASGGGPPAGAGPASTTGGAGAPEVTPDGYVVIDPASEEVADHYLTTEDLVAAGLLGPEHDPAPLPPPRRGHHRLRSAVLLSLALVLVLIVVAGLYVRSQVNPGGKPGTKVTVVIPTHSGSTEIGSILAKAKVIHDGSLFPYYAKLSGAGTLLPGKYKLATNESYSSVVTALEAGPPKTVDKLVVPEGYTLQEIARRVASLPGLHLSAAKFLAAASNGNVRSPYEPPGVNNLEGLVFPATYQVSSDDTEVNVLQQMVTAFDEQAKNVGLAAGAAQLGVTPYDVVKVASIIEGEAKLDGDRGPVASAIYNRLKAGMPLGTDSTLVYALRQQNPGVNIANIDYNQPNPYNTRLNKGLPPTPIANPGVPSLQAAAHPPATNYLYFVEINPDGKLGFASTNSGFVQLEQQCAASNLC
jgi:UPF0755 protein